MEGDTRHILTILAVEDIAASLAFYRAAFGWTPEVDTPVYVGSLTPSSAHTAARRAPARMRS